MKTAGKIILIGGGIAVVAIAIVLITKKKKQVSSIATIPGISESPGGVTTNEDPAKKKNTGLILGITAGVAAIATAIIANSKKKKQEDQKKTISKSLTINPNLVI